MGTHSRLTDHRHRRRRRDNGSAPEDFPIARPSVLDYRPISSSSSSHRRQSLLPQQGSAGSSLLPHQDSSSSEEEEDDMNLEKEMLPLGHYVNDPPRMIEEIFSVIKGAKLQAMLTSNLKDMSSTELQESCLLQLEGMSKKRIRCILNGEDMDESSDTEEDEEENECRSPSESRSSPETSALLAPLDPLDDVTKEIESPEAQDIEKKSVRLLKEDEVVNASQGSETDIPKDPNPGSEIGAEHSKMELLELEMRARAIKALLGKKVTKASSEIKINIVPEDDDQKANTGEDSQRRRKAREVLETSQARKQQDTESREKKQKEMFQRILDHTRSMKAKETKKKEEEAERLRVKRKKEEERRKFLQWKEEKALREQDETRERVSPEKLRRKRRPNEEMSRKYRSQKPQSDNGHSPVSSEEDEVLRRKASDIEDGEVESDGSESKRIKRTAKAEEDSSCFEDEIQKHPPLKKKKERMRNEDSEDSDVKMQEVVDDKDFDRKERERMEKLRRDRLKRMAAFQERTDIFESNLSSGSEGSSNEEDSKMPNEDAVLKENDFYKSYLEEDENDSKEKPITEEEDKEDPLPCIHPPPGAKKPKVKIDGIAEVAKLCESQGDFEKTPPRPPKPDSPPKGIEEAEEDEPETWADRWYQDKNVQRVVKESKALSKVRNNMKKAAAKSSLKAEPPKDANPDKLEEVASSLPDVSTVGSMEQYAKIVGKSLDEVNRAQASEEEEEYEDDEISLGEGDEELWGEILGTNNE